MSHSARSHAADADVPALQLATSQAAPYAVVIKWNDRDVHGGCRIAMPCATGPKRRRRALRGFGDLSVMGPLLNRDAQLELWRSADLSLPRQRTRSAPSREGARRERSAVVAPGTK